MKNTNVNQKIVVSILTIMLLVVGVQGISYAQTLSASSTPQPLTEATLNGTEVRLTLHGLTYAAGGGWSAESALKVSGITGVTIDNVSMLNTVATVKLGFSGNINAPSTLTFTLEAGGIRDYQGPPLTVELPVSASDESVRASTVSPLTEATLDGSIVTLTLHGRNYRHLDLDRIGVANSLKVSGIAGVTLKRVSSPFIYTKVDQVSSTEMTVTLNFNGRDFDGPSNRLTFTVEDVAIANYRGPALTVDLPVSASDESMRAFTASPLTEATLDGNTVTLTLQDRVYSSYYNRYPLTVSGIAGVTDSFNHHRSSPTELKFNLVFDGDIDTASTLTFTMEAEAIENYKGPALTATLPVPASDEYVVASAASPLTETTLDGNIVTLTLHGGRVFETSRNDIARDLRVSGIAGVTAPSYNVNRVSDTAVTVKLDFNGNINTATTLTFTVNAGAIAGYKGATLKAELPVFGGDESVRASTASPLTEATLNNSTVILTLRGRTFESNIRSYVSVSGISRVSIGNVRLLSNTEVEVTLQFSGDFDRDATLQFRVRSGGIKNYNGSELTTTLPVSAVAETQPPVVVAETPVNTQQSTVAPTPQPNVVTTPQPTVVTTPNTNVVTTPQPTVVAIPDRNLRAAIQQEIGNTITTQTLLNLTSLDAYDLGITNLTGLEHATNLSVLHLWGNSISDISPLAGLTQLTELDLFDNNISDISPLVGLTRLTDLYLKDNPLNDAALTTYIPAIQANGTEVSFDDRTPTTSPPPSMETHTPTGPIDPSQPAIYLGGGAGIQRANLDGSNVQTLVEGVDPFKLALDVAERKMYWINWESIQRANLDGSQVEILVKTLGTRGASEFELTLDVLGGKMYWRHSKWDEGTSKIRRANLDGSNVETLVEIGFPVFPNLDVSSRKMYWGDDIGIRRANLDGSNVETLVREEYVWPLTLDASGGKMYWGDDIGIRRANLDGSNVETLVREEYAWQLALDASGGKIYWIGYDVDSTPSKIHCANLDGSNVETLVREEYTKHLTLDVAGGKMYWIGDDGESTKIRRANLDGSNIEDLTTASMYADTFALAPADDASPPVVSKKPEVDTQTKTTQILVDAADSPSMYWIDTAAGTLHRLVNAEVENLVPSVQNATSLTVDVDNDALYWAEKTSNTTGKIQRANLDGTNVQLVLDLTSVPFDIALDAEKGKLYLTNSWGKVQRLNLDGSGFQSNLITGLDMLTGIAIDVVGGKLYWTEKTSNTTGKIRRANLDGTNVQLLRDLTSMPFDIALDATNGKLYLTNSWGNVQRLKLDGSGFEPNFITGLDTPMDIAVDTVGQKLYLTSPDGKISQRNLSGGGSEEVVTGLGSPGALVLGDAILDDQMAVTTPQMTPPATTYRAEDVNQDGRVDDVDLGIVAAALFGENPPATPGRLDVNGDGKLTIADLRQVSNNLDDDAAAAPALGVQHNALAREKIQAAIDLLLATDDGSLGVRRTLAYLQNLLAAVHPDETHLFANYPNPFNPETWIPYQLATGSDVRITLYDASGRIVRKLVLGYQSSGYYTSRSRAAYWDGRNVVGEPVASGLYFYTFTADDFTATRRMLILK